MLNQVHNDIEDVIEDDDGGGDDDGDKCSHRTSNVMHESIIGIMGSHLWWKYASLTPKPDVNMCGFTTMIPNMGSVAGLQVVPNDELNDASHCACEVWRPHNTSHGW